MFKWVLGLCASIYLTLLVFGGAPEEVAEAAPETPTVETSVAEAASETPVVETPVADTVAAVEETSAPLIEPTIEPVTEPVLVADTAAPAPTVAAPAVTVETLTPIASSSQTIALTQPEPEPVLVAATPQAEPTPLNQIWTVTGSTVNLRDLPGTNGAVIGQTRRGNSAEVIELLENGWARVFILESGLEAYMSAAFLSDQQS